LRSSYPPIFSNNWPRKPPTIVSASTRVVETPQLGHATYVFAKPRSMEGFLALYTRIAKEDIRRNRDNVSERLGFLGRVIHGMNPQAWLKEMRQRL
jgi:hypothetical protein